MRGFDAYLSQSYTAPKIHGLNIQKDELSDIELARHHPVGSQPRRFADTFILVLLTNRNPSIRYVVYFLLLNVLSINNHKGGRYSNILCSRVEPQSRRKPQPDARVRFALVDRVYFIAWAANVVSFLTVRNRLGRCMTTLVFANPSPRHWSLT